MTEVLLGMKKKSRQLLEEHSNRLKAMHGRDESTWLMQDGTVLKTTMDIIDRGRYELKVIISEGVQDQHTINALYYEPKL
jgi:hypothetical protein